MANLKSVSEAFSVVAAASVRVRASEKRKPKIENHQ